MKAFIASLALAALASGTVQAEDLQAELLAREQAGWAAWGRHDGAGQTADSTEDLEQIIVGVGRIVGRSAVATAANTHDCVMKHFELSDANLRQLASDVAVLSYRASQDTSCGGKAVPASVYATSIYVHRNGKWLAAGYQETPIE